MNIKEIMVMHHSHMDVGYTHSQPILWELQREFLDSALEVIEETKEWPGGGQVRWTSEVTSQIMHWLKYASPEQKLKLKEYIKDERFGISGMEYNTTPLANADELAYQLRHVKYLNEEYGANIKTVNQHDVNGIPWGAVDVMLDAGIELLIMAVNIHFGHAVAERPSVFKWRGPSGRDIFVMNGNHYTMFDQITNVHLGRLDKMKEGYEIYLKHLEKINYKHDFLYLTTANAPVNYDNSPPNTSTALMIQKWNADAGLPPVRYITPNMLLEKIKSIPDSELLTHTGDWTDYWNFGCASTAHETRVNSETKIKLRAAEMISTLNENDAQVKSRILNDAKQNLVLYDEHTWGAYNSMDPDNDFVRMQENFNKSYAHIGHELAEYSVINELEELAGNPGYSEDQHGVLAVNSSPLKKKTFFRIPEWWEREGKRHRTARLSWPNRNPAGQPIKIYGPVEMEPYSWKFFTFDEFSEAGKQNAVVYGEEKKVTEIQRLNRDEMDQVVEGISFIESPFHRMEYDAATGRIFSLFDKERNWEVLDKNNKYTFFQFVRQTTDKLINGGRTAMYSRNIDLEKYDVGGWQTDWKAIFETAYELLNSEIIELPEGLALKLKFSAPGVEFVEQTITFQGNSPVIKLEARMKKLDYIDPESIYFTFPLNMKKGWQNHFDSAGIVCELDKEQLPLSCKGWQTVETFSSIHNGDLGATLVCPDAPMVMAGGFNFSKLYFEIERNENPMLLAWPVNNYWDTNFAATQPGMLKFSYSFVTHGKFNAAEITAVAMDELSGVEVHPAIVKPKMPAGSFVKIHGEGVNILNIKRTFNFENVHVRIINNSGVNQKVTLEFPYGIKNASLADTLDNDIEQLNVKQNLVEVELIPRKVTNIKIIKA